MSLAIAVGGAFSQDSAKKYEKLSPSQQDEFLKNISKNFEEINTLKTDFIQVRYLDIFLEPLTAQGICYFEKPEKLRWELLQPYPSIMVYNKKQVAKFDFNDGKLRKLHLDTDDIMREILGQITSWMKGDFTQTSDIYTLSVFKGKDYLLTFTPKSKEMAKNIQSIELSLNPVSQHVTKVTIREKKEDRIEISFLNEVINVKFEDTLFDLDKPKLNQKLKAEIDEK